jgi:hypothetical protein
MIESRQGIAFSCGAIFRISLRVRVGRLAAIRKHRSSVLVDNLDIETLLLTRDPPLKSCKNRDERASIAQ